MSQELSCPSGKKMFAEKEWAVRFVDRRAKFKGQRPYRCEKCGYWHLTTANAASREYIRRTLR